MKGFCQEYNILNYFNSLDHTHPFELEFGEKHESCKKIFDFYPEKAKEQLSKPNAKKSRSTSKNNTKDSNKKSAIARKYGEIMTNHKDKLSIK